MRPLGILARVGLRLETVLQVAIDAVATDVSCPSTVTFAAF
jgi:hypothetical protein